MPQLTTLPGAARPWLMEPIALATLLRTAAPLEMPTPRQMEKGRHLAAERLRKVSGKVAVLPVQGMVTHRYSAWSYWFGGACCENLSLALDQLAADKSCAAIVLDIDSPGGEADGVEELSDKINDVKKTKPIYAVSNAMCASAAYWIGASASNLYCTPSGQVGSVGVYMGHIDYSAAMAEEGVKVTLVSAGQYKTERSPYEPLSDDARQAMQDEVDGLYAKFCKAVAVGRNCSVDTVRRDFGRGRLVSADEAVAAKMCDGQMALAQLMERLGAVHPKADRIKPNMTAIRLQVEREREDVR